MKKGTVSRREFLKLASISAAGFAFQPLLGSFSPNEVSLPDFPQSDRLARVASGVVEVKARPAFSSQTIRTLYEDAVVPWYQELVGDESAYVFNNQRWVETTDGYMYSPLLQPVKNLPNPILDDLPDSSKGPGLWAEITVPYVDVVLETEPTTNSWVEARIDEGLPVRLYYKQVFWIDQIKQDDAGRTLYRANPNYYGGVDMLWAEGEAFRPISEEEVSPISPDVEDKKIYVDVANQTLSCFEGNEEVYFCRVSTGALYDYLGSRVDHWETPPGKHIITRKYFSLQMSGGTTGAGYDLPGIGWSIIFATGGVAIHSTFWHNNYGDTMSHGCVNVTPEDAKWIFRWSNPYTAYDPGAIDVTVTGENSTGVIVETV